MDEATLRVDPVEVQEVLVGQGILDGLPAMIGERLGGADQVIVVADENALRASPRLGEALASVDAHVVSVRGGEHVKSIDWVLGLIGILQSLEATRGSLLLAVGGGSLLDAAGFTASIYMRGMKHATIPSTLLSMADAAIGGKNGVNHGGAKNILGCIRLPRLTLVDPLLLGGLPERHYREGFAEIVKHALLDSWERLEWLQARTRLLLARNPEALEEVLAWSARFKAGVVERDPFEERGLRAILNLGHTIGHAIEAATDARVSHGEAVAAGLYLEALFSKHLGIAREDVPQQVRGALRAFHLDTRPPVEPERLAARVGRDKKRRGDRILMPLLEEPGKVRLEWVPLDKLRSWLETLS